MARATTTPAHVSEHIQGPAHQRDDLLHGRRVGGIEPPAVAGRATTGVITRHRRGRSPATGSIDHSKTVIGSPPDCTAAFAARHVIGLSGQLAEPAEAPAGGLDAARLIDREADVPRLIARRDRARDA